MTWSSPVLEIICWTVLNVYLSNHKLTVTDSVSKPLKVGMQCADFCTNSSSIWAFLFTSVLSLQVQSRGSQAVVKPVLYLFPPVFYKLNVGMLYTSNLFVT